MDEKEKHEVDVLKGSYIAPYKTKFEKEEIVILSPGTDIWEYILPAPEQPASSIRTLREYNTKLSEKFLRQITSFATESYAQLLQPFVAFCSNPIIFTDKEESDQDYHYLSNNILFCPPLSSVWMPSNGVFNPLNGLLISSSSHPIRLPLQVDSDYQFSMINFYSKPQFSGAMINAGTPVWSIDFTYVNDCNESTFHFLAIGTRQCNVHFLFSEWIKDDLRQDRNGICYQPPASMGIPICCSQHAEADPTGYLSGAIQIWNCGQLSKGSKYGRMKFNDKKKLKFFNRDKTKEGSINKEEEEEEEEIPQAFKEEYSSQRLGDTTLFPPPTRDQSTPPSVDDLPFLSLLVAHGCGCVYTLKWNPHVRADDPDKAIDELFASQNKQTDSSSPPTDFSSSSSLPNISNTFAPEATSHLTDSSGSVAIPRLGVMAVSCVGACFVCSVPHPSFVSECQQFTSQKRINSAPIDSASSSMHQDTRPADRNQSELFSFPADIKPNSVDSTSPQHNLNESYPPQTAHPAAPSASPFPPCVPLSALPHSFLVLPYEVSVWCLDWSFHNPSLLACGCSDGAVRLYNITEFTSYHFESTSSSPFSFSQSPSLLFSEETFYPTFIPAYMSIPMSHFPIRAVSFSPFSPSQLVAGGHDSRLHFLDLNAPYFGASRCKSISIPDKDDDGDEDDEKATNDGKPESGKANETKQKSNKKSKKTSAEKGEKEESVSSSNTLLQQYGKLGKGMETQSSNWVMGIDWVSPTRIIMGMDDNTVRIVDVVERLITNQNATGTLFDSQKESKEGEKSEMNAITAEDEKNVPDEKEINEGDEEDEEVIEIKESGSAKQKRDETNENDSKSEENESQPKKKTTSSEKKKPSVPVKSGKNIDHTLQVSVFDIFSSPVMSVAHSLYSGLSVVSCSDGRCVVVGSMGLREKKSRVLSILEILAITQSTEEDIQRWIKSIGTEEKQEQKRKEQIMKMSSSGVTNAADSNKNAPQLDSAESGFALFSVSGKHKTPPIVVPSMKSVWNSFASLVISTCVGDHPSAGEAAPSPVNDNRSGEELTPLERLVNSFSRHLHQNVISANSLSQYLSVISFPFVSHSLHSTLNRTLRLTPVTNDPLQASILTKLSMTPQKAEKEKKKKEEDGSSVQTQISPVLSLKYPSLNLKDIHTIVAKNRTIFSLPPRGHNANCVCWNKSGTKSGNWVAVGFQSGIIRLSRITVDS
ncbi:uncharacterized protein MONOS_8477 [Monocercomonoides exilis]|uniref:uncharacterized protein n=1 Tax=Monocercomonoides exilis TaxID=2049356 RepID=UPI00355944B9|nr:hypothetical protein MONOS_8477 [Monocercomonoides exilis]|eukprot:MONOS_8477.1-p1 / transcript=MONOS_8477.1 / gene=MONOS_8477 / organism=Monocercomonoides_exilis_PA203 / gene_product=unspecified product / transcript_product=unspecified product / location=Mono_scaffold00320:53325-57029(-) / protein_length=1210 / sequence_SO=supercontig / SO=protein_coding / is_pseudo=false